MKNKRAKLIEDNNKSTRLLNPQNRNVNLKNREQLRKKLKGLLEKDKSSVHLLTSNTSIVQNTKVNEIPRSIHEKDVLNKKKANKATVVKTPQVLKPTQIPVDNRQSLKRKNKQKIEPPKKAPKPTPTINSRIQTQQKVSPLNGKGPILPKKLKQKAEKITKNKKLPTVQSKKKQVESIEDGNSIIKIKITPKKPKDNTNKDPLRPNTTEPDPNDRLRVPPPKPPKKKQKPNAKKGKKPINTEQALTRVLCDDKGESSDGTYIIDDDDYYSQDYECSSSDDCTFYSDDDSLDSLETDSYDEDDHDDDDDYDDEVGSSYWSDTASSESCPYYDSNSDDTYELPAHVAEDVYVATGTAVKHDLSEINEINFDSDTSTAQVIEIPPTPDKNPTIAAPNTVSSKLSIRKTSESDDSCPELVPINFTNHKDSDVCYDCSSFSGSDTDSDSASEESEHSVDPPQMTPEIFKADKTEKQDFDIPFFQTTKDMTRECVAGSPLDRIVNSKSKTASYKVITVNNQVVNPKSEANVPSKYTKQVEKSQPQFEEQLFQKAQLETVDIEKPQPVTGQSAVPFTNNVESSYLPSEIKTPLIEILPPATKIIDNVPPVNGDTVATPIKISPDNSSCPTLFFNAINSNQVIALLKDPLYIYGTVKLKLIAGALEIFGYNPKRNEMLEIFSPRGYSSLRVLPLKNTDLNTSLKELLTLVPFFVRTDLEEIIEKFDVKKDAIVVLERNDRSKKVNMLRKYMVEHLFPNMNSMQSDRPFYTSEFLLRCILTTKTDKPLLVDPRWTTITVTNNSKVLVIGGKSVGKSTLVRYLINKNLNSYPKILLIDLDIGQPEIFVPQTVSATTLSTPLLGPGYFLNKEPDKAFLVGQTNVVFLPQRYIENVQALIDYCKENEAYRDIPWIVNTMGYNKGFGDELIAVIGNLLRPTNIVQLESRKEINNFDYIMSKEVLQSMERTITGGMLCCGDVYRPQHQLTLMASVIPNDKKYQKEWDMNPRDMRLAMILSRLSAIIKGYADWLTDIKPVCAPMDDLTFVNLGDDPINREDILQTLVGNLVYLCRQNPEIGKPHECFGIGIVRGIDYNLKQIYLLPAVPLDVLKYVNCLAVCGIPLPSSVLINQGPKVKGVASYIYNTVDEAASMYIKQIYNRPQHFFTAGKNNYPVDVE